MPIYEPQTLPRPQHYSLLRAILKQILLALMVGSSVLGLYLYINHLQNIDSTIGKYAFISKKDEYLGVIKWHGRSTRSGITVFVIQQPTGDLIEISAAYVIVRENPPKAD
jgi:hypothetical protein